VTAEFRRLGKPGAYRLGRLRAQGIAEPRQPALMRPRFTRRREHRWPVSVWLVGLLAGAAMIGVALAYGWWFVPVLAGLGAGLANREGGWPPRIALPAVAAMSVVGAALPRLLSRWLSLPNAVHATTALDAVLVALAGYGLASMAGRRSARGD
jgi:hypothetical protein